MVAGGEEIATPPASRNSDTTTTHSGIGVRPDASSPSAPISGDQDADGEGAGDAPPFGGPAGEVSEGHEPRGVESERERVPERGQPVDVLQHERRPGEVGEQRRVQEPLVQDRAEEHPIGEQSAEVAQRLREPAARAALGGKGLAEHAQGHDEDAGTDQGEEDEQSAPIGERVQQPAEERSDDRGEPADDCESAVEPDECAAGVDVTAGGLGDDDPDPAGESLHESRGDQQLDRGADRAQCGCGDVREMPISRMPRRPNRSDSGPAISCPAARPIRQAVTVSCATEVAAPSSAVRAGRAGRYRSIEIGPNTVSSSSSVGSARRTAGGGGDVIGHDSSLTAAGVGGSL